MRKLLLIILLCLILTGCNNNQALKDAVEDIADEYNYDDYVYTYQKTNESNTYIVTFYIDGLRYVTATFIVCGDDWEVINIE
jgi:hypothetical protein